MPLPPFESHHPHLIALHACHRAMAADVDPLAPAELRAALRTMSVGDLLGLAYTLGDIVELAEQVRSAAVRQARMGGATVEEVAAAMELSERRLLANHPIPRIDYTPVPTGDVLELYEIPAGSTVRQPVLLDLDVRTGALSVFVSPEVSPDSRPEGVDTGVLLRWPLPLLTPRGANDLMRQVKPLARRVCFGTDINQDKAGHDTARLDADADQARQEITELCEEALDTFQCLVEVEAADFFPRSADRTAADYGLNAASTDEQIAAAAEHAEEQALEDLQILRGAAEHLAQAVAALEVDTQLVLAVVEGTRPQVVLADLLVSGDFPSLGSPEITAWVQAQRLEDHRDRWIAVSFAAVEAHVAAQVFTLPEDEAIALARLLDAEEAGL
jgi:hypothetical protein